MRTAVFKRFEIQLTEAQAMQGSHAGSCDDDIAWLLRDRAIRTQLAAIGSEKIAAELAEYTDWDTSDKDENRARIIWIACGDIREEIYEEQKHK